MCSYDPPEGSKKLIKDLCQFLVNEIRRLEKIGDPIGVSVEEVKELIDHLYDPSQCKKD